jgi:retron-type reverse transcriptase
MLPIYKKVLECADKEQIMNSIESNEILINEQSGFRKYHSCETALNLVLNNWKEHIEKKKAILAVILDLKRAFETIDRNILLRKLKSYGIRGLVLKWFESFSANRMQRKKFGDSYSEISHINLGVPQGSVLAPILFILYMNDIVTKNCSLYNVNLFADETLVSIAGNDTMMTSRENLMKIW